MAFIHPTELRKRYPFLAKKSLGQHFLVHRPILETLAKRILQHHPHTVLEIGPGPGSLSQLIAPSVKRLILIEKDPQFKSLLEEVVAPLGSVEIYIEDFLTVDLPSHLPPPASPTIATGNLPYNVSVPILQKLLRHREIFTHFYLMFQKEVARRLAANPSTPAYGSLTLYVQMLAQVKIILPIPRSAFDPRPQVESAVVEIIPRPKPLFPDLDLNLFQKITQAAFNPRRKMILNNLMKLRPSLSKREWEILLNSLELDPKRRGETLSLEEFSKLTLGLQKKPH